MPKSDLESSHYTSTRRPYKLLREEIIGSSSGERRVTGTNDRRTSDNKRLTSDDGRIDDKRTTYKRRLNTENGQTNGQLD